MAESGQWFDCFEEFSGDLLEVLDTESITEIQNDEKCVSNNYDHKIDEKGDNDSEWWEQEVYSDVSALRLSKLRALSTIDCHQKWQSFNDEIFAVSDNKYNANYILSLILDWNTDWLTQRSDSKVINRLSRFGEGIGLKTCYKSLDEYQSAYIPLVLLETWAQIYNDFNNNEKHFDFEATTAPDIDSNDIPFMKTINPFKKLRLYKVVAGNVIEEYPSNGQLLTLEFTNESSKKVLIFGYIMKFYSEEIMPSTRTWLYKQLGLSTEAEEPEPTYLRPHLLKYVVAFSDNFKISEISRTIKVKAFHHLKPTMRQIGLISNLKNSPLYRDILKPRSLTCKVEVPNKISLSCHNFNESQSTAILSSFEAVNSPYTVPKLVLIQGPPGTGKTFTLIEILKYMFMNWNSEERLPRILICAPSNGAVNEISRRVYNEKDFLVKHRLEKHRRDLRCVRVGNESKIQGDDRTMLLEQMVKHIVDKLKTKKRLMEAKVRLLETKIAKLNEEMESNGFNSDTSEERSALMVEVLKARALGRQIKIESSDKIKMDIMKEADVVLSTLNSSHSSPIEYLYLYNGPNTFDCVIVDEASQCGEPELLMPLVYRMSKMILIGDPMQLPATVISKRAGSLKLGRSLFERFYNHFRECEENRPNEESPVLMLTEQYRMHPQICQFPSSQFYDGKLVTSSEVMKSRDFNLLKPYIVFDVLDTIENSDPNNKSKYNVKEANFVIRLVTLIDQMVNRSAVNHNGYTVGVITPYNGQKNHLIKNLKNKRFKNIVIDINTVDGFQGQERDIIIFSGVRSFDEKNKFKSIGFLNSVQRMNVALTRAKYSMILCISGHSLQRDKTWKSLIEDSIRRTNIHFKVSSTEVSLTSNEIMKILAPID